jgi:hypothetical protein
VEGSDDWEGQYSYGSTLQSQTGDADAQIDRGLGLVSARSRASIPRGQGDSWRLENGGPIAGDSISASGPAQFGDEMWMAAELLQAMAQDHQLMRELVKAASGSLYSSLWRMAGGWCERDPTWSPLLHISPLRCISIRQLVPRMYAWTTKPWWWILIEGGSQRSHARCSCVQLRVVLCVAGSPVRESDCLML